MALSLRKLHSAIPQDIQPAGARRHCYSQSLTSPSQGIRLIGDTINDGVYLNSIDRAHSLIGSDALLVSAVRTAFA